jgi:hypothetical protein
VTSRYALDAVKRGLLPILLRPILILSMLTPFSESLDSTLTLHIVVQHVFYLAGGFMLASGADLLVLGWSKFSETVTSAYTALMRANVHFNRHGLLTFALAAALTAY